MALGAFAGGCATRTPAVAVIAAAPVVKTPAPPTPVAVAAPVVDPVADLIAASNRHFETGERELGLGHLEQARTDFNRALEVLLESPYGARFEPRIREHFDLMVEKIAGREAAALAQGDGFTEKKYDRASIDDLLAISTFQPTTPETEEAVAADLKATIYDIDIPMNSRVLAYVELFSGRLKTYLEEALGRSVRYLPMIQDVFRAEGLPLDLAYVPLIESAFKPNAVSRAKAKGLWQFMRGTALENGLKHDWYIDERAEPEKATKAAAKYLKTLHRMFDDWHLALASYNGGPGRVQRAMKRSKRSDFWALTSTSRYLPRETRDYVPLILAAVIVARNPAQYGLSVPPPGIDATSFETVMLPSAVDLRHIAEWTDSPIETIQNLNPELRRWTTPIKAQNYALRVPAGTAAVVEARLAEMDDPELAPLNWHAVKKGETLAVIARKLKVNRADLAEANYLSVKSRVTPGQKLIIPRAPTLLLAAKTDVPAPVAESRPIPAATTTAVQTTASKVVHRVKQGDTLFSIARLYRTTVASLKNWNRLRSNAIRVGDRLTILTSRTAAAN